MIISQGAQGPSLLILSVHGRHGVIIVLSFDAYIVSRDSPVAIVLLSLFFSNPSLVRPARHFARRRGRMRIDEDDRVGLHIFEDLRAILSSRLMKFTEIEQKFIARKYF